MKILVLVLALGAACGNAPTATTVPTAAASDPAPPEGSLGACTVARDCGIHGARVKCMRRDQGSYCYRSPAKICDEPSCGCFESDPCVATGLGTCTGYDRGVVICTR